VGSGRLDGLRARGSAARAEGGEGSERDRVAAAEEGGGGKAGAQVRRESALLEVLTAHEAARLRLWANPVEAERQSANTLQVSVIYSPPCMCVVYSPRGGAAATLGTPS
jgi:hypothetical protein